MRDKSLGQLLRESRVGKKITLDEIESKTGISSHYLLAMELDQFKIIPESKLDGFLKQYADIVLLDFDLLKSQYNQQMADRKLTNFEPSVTQIVEEKLSQQRSTNTVIVPPVKTSDVANDLEKQWDQKVQLKTLIDKSNEKVNLSKDNLDTIPIEDNKSLKESTTRPSIIRESDDSGNETEKTRLSRYNEEDTKSKSFFSIILLCLIALAIISFIFFVVWRQHIKQNEKVNQAKTEFLDESQKGKKAKESSASSEPRTKVTTEVQENYLLATVDKSKDTVEVTVSLKDIDSAWISLTNSDIGEAGTTLTVDNPSYTVTFPAETTESLLTLGLAQGISVKIDGEEVDLSSLPTTDVSYIALQFNSKAEQ